MRRLVSLPTLFVVEKLGFKELVNMINMDLAFPNSSLIVQAGVMRKKSDLFFSMPFALRTLRIV
jgi:hypothetical protein